MEVMAKIVLPFISSEVEIDILIWNTLGKVQLDTFVGIKLVEKEK